MEKGLNIMKAVVLLIPLLLFALIAFVVAIPAMITRQRWKFLNKVFLIPFGIVVRYLLSVKMVVLNEEKIHSRRPCVLLGNHQSSLDLAVVGTVCPGGSVIVGKKEIARIPLFGWYWKSAGNLFLDRSNPKVAKQALTDIAQEVHKNHINVAIFPEGTRNTGKSPGLLPFKKGAFHLARELKVPLIPVVTSSMRGRIIWETFELSGGTVIVSVLDPVETSDWTDANTPQKIEEIRQRMAAEFERISVLAASQEFG